MKKTLLAILILFSAFYASAQDRGSWGIGPKINLYTHTGRAPSSASAAISDTA